MGQQTIDIAGAVRHAAPTHIAEGGSDMKLATTIVALGLLLTACASDPLAGARWTLVSLNGQTPVKEHPITLHFSGGELDGHAGCNSYGGRYEADGDRMRFPDDPDGAGLWSELVGCPAADAMLQEEEYLRTLRQVASYRKVGNRLELMDRKGQRTLVFEEAE